MGYESLFSHRSMKDIMNYMSSQNIATQGCDAESDGGTDFATAGGAQCVVNGTFVASLTAATNIDLGDADTCPPSLLGVDLAGYVTPDNEIVYYLITVEADGTAHVYLASNRPAITVQPTLKIPYYSPDELAIGLVLYDNNDLNATLTLGTDILSVDDDTWYQLIGPSILPHVDNFDKN
jgi:hypothetical protein